VLTRYRNQSLFVFLIVALSMIAGACGAEEKTGDCRVAEDGVLVNSDCEVAPGVTLEPTATPSDSNGGGGADPAFGLFRANGCSACHAIDGTAATGQIGPNLTSVASKGGADYIRESIVDPSAVVADGFSDGIMPKNFGEVIPAEDLDALVAYLNGL
jgi:cytochrome c551/c552